MTLFFVKGRGLKKDRSKGKRMEDTTGREERMVSYL